MRRRCFCLLVYRNLPPSRAVPQVYVYEMNRAPINVALAMFSAIREQGAKFTTWFLEDKAGAGAAAKPAAA